MSTADDLTGIFTQLANTTGGDLGFRAGRVTAWDPVTGANTIVVAGTALSNVPFLSSVGSFVVDVGDVVGLLKVKSQFFVLGVISVAPPNATQQQISQLAESTSADFANDRARLDTLENEGDADVYTPTAINVTLGDGTITGQWSRIRDFVFWEFRLTMGSTTTVSGNIGIILPFDALAPGGLVLGSGYVGRGTLATGRTVGTLRKTAPPDQAQMWFNGGTVNATSPLSGGTWQSGDVFAGAGTYLAA